MRKTNKWAGYFPPCSRQGEILKFQTFVKSPSRKHPKPNCKSCCMGNTVKEKQPALFLAGLSSACSSLSPLLPVAVRAVARAWCRWSVPGADVLALSQMFWESRGCWQCPGQPTSLHTPSPPQNPPRIPMYLMSLQKCWWTATWRWLQCTLWSNFNKFSCRRRSWIEHAGWLLQTAWFWLQAQEIEWNNMQSLAYPI